MESTESTETLIQKFNEYKIETEFFHRYVVQRTCEWKRLTSSRLWETSTWRRKKLIGKGGFGTVWLEEKDEEKGVGQRECGEKAKVEKQLRAVKELPRESLLDAARSQELLALVKLREHNHLFVEFLGWYEDRHQTFFAMEYIEHGDLSEYMKSQRVRTVAEVQEITRQILEGLQVLHGKGICHRDLKPQNILMASLDPLWIKIADFGVAKRLKNTFARTQIFSLGYTAPEMLGVVPPKFIENGFTPFALDIWSLGSIVHELLTSETPFLKPAYRPDINPVSGLSDAEFPEREADYASLCSYCRGNIEFPMDSLLRSQLGGEEEIAFVKSLLIADPRERPTVARVLRSLWLTGPGSDYKSDYVQSLRNQFLCLGVDLEFRDRDNRFMRQVRKGDIIRFLPSSASVPSLVLGAVANSFTLVISRLFRSPNYDFRSIDSSTRGTLFKLAAETGQLDTVEILLQHKLQVGACIGDQKVLHWAVESGHVDTVRKLMENTNDRDPELLLRAVRLGNVDMVRIFLNKNVNINVTYGCGPAALQTAAKRGNPDIVQLLLGSNADVNAKAVQSDARTALQAAAGGGHVYTVELLLRCGADVNAEAAEDGGRTALQAAAENGYRDIVQFLLESYADPNAKAAKYGGRTALQAAAGGGHIDTVTFLLGRGADVNAEAAERDGRTALQAAAGGGHIDVVTFLLGWGADVNAEAAEYGGRTALQAAAEGGHSNIVQLLLESYADPNAKAKYDGRTALQAAAKVGHIDIAMLLLGRGADVNAEAAWSGGRTALQAAAEGGNVDIVTFLLGHGADVNAEAVWGGGRTALQAAAGGGNIDIVTFLLESGADVNADAAEYRGRTALQAGAEGGHVGIVRLLLKNGADFEARAAKIGGRTALQAAESSANKDIIKLFKDLNDLRR